MHQADLLRYVCTHLETAGIPHMLVGSFASMSYGEPRFTKDIDIVVDLRGPAIPMLVGWFPKDEYYRSADAIREAVRLRSQFNVIHPESGNKVDFMVARDDPWGRSQMARRRRVRVTPELNGFVAAPEDVILGKLLYFSEGASDKHLRDVAGILRVQGDAIDRAYLEHWARELGVEDVWRTVVEREASAS